MDEVFMGNPSIEDERHADFVQWVEDGIIRSKGEDEKWEVHTI